jgi:hypothetical protein
MCRGEQRVRAVAEDVVVAFDTCPHDAARGVGDELGEAFELGRGRGERGLRRERERCANDDASRAAGRLAQRVERAVDRVVALAASQQAYVLESGRVAVEGTSDELRRHESVRRSYLGY